MKLVARNQTLILLTSWKVVCKLEETAYWLELIAEANIFMEERLKPLHTEAEELTAMFVAMVKTVKNRVKK
jgi:hypothetical protein